MEPEKLADVNEKLASLMRKAFAGGTEVRFDNPGLKTCWMMFECKKESYCPLSGKSGQRCWQILGSFSEEGGCCHLPNILDCRKCDVYQASIGGDTMTDIGETFNNMMHLIERTQGRMVEMEKLVTTGKLAASVAHEINNPLFGISNYVDLILARNSGDEKTVHYINIVKEAINQIRMVTRGLLELAKPRAAQPSDSDLHHEIDRVISLIAPKAAKQKISIVRIFSPDVSYVWMDRESMHQVFLNLAINAIESMPSGGELTILTSIKNANVEIVFKDTGHGIAEEDLPRVFDLFFSKKMKGLGTGIGLYTARRILDDHDGLITVESTPGQGTSFTVSFPKARDI